jgi:acetoin utilization deacetylase AcuC-like enzyme
MLKIAWTNQYAHPLPENHRFPMLKYELLPEQLMHEGTVMQDNFFTPGELDETDILSIHDPEYWQRLKSLRLTRAEERRTGFPLSEKLVERERIIARGTIECGLYALKHGISMNIAGGTHHAFTDRGEGFCLLNDIALSANYLLRNGKVQKVLVVDLDVHQGNGTAEIFSEESRVFTFSMHGEKNYPYHKEISDLDIGLPDGCGDFQYLNTLKEILPPLLEEVTPDIVYFQSGVDILTTDKLGRLAVSQRGCYNRDKYVLELCKMNGIPVVVVMGGGYSPEIKHIVEAHANTFRLAQEIFF